jgi:hypothetical protein
MKKTIFYLFAALPLLLVSCGEDFFDQKNLYEKDLNSYYRNSNEVNEALVGAYACLATDAGIGHPILIANLKSDDCFAGGGTNDVASAALDQFTNPVENLEEPAYNRNYEGIFRINTLLKNVSKTVYQDSTIKHQQLGEAYFLRALFYFRLAQIFGEVPLDLSPELEYLPKASSSEIYSRISSDLNTAISLLPDTKATKMDPMDNGRATKWAAEALMARVYLFYTGYYQQTSLPLAEGGSISKDQVVGWLEDCIGNSGHTLVSDFRSLWPFSALGDSAKLASDYEFAKDVKWAGDGNIEEVFAVKYNNQGHWANAGNNGKLSYSNQLVFFSSLRGQKQEDVAPFGTGWGMGTVNPQLYNCYEDGDIRKRSTVIDQATELTKYTWNGDNNLHETGLSNKKYNAVVVKNKKGDGLTGMYYMLYGGQNESNQLWNMQDDVIIRFSDVLLMAAELGSNSQTYLDMVRNRAFYPNPAPAMTYSLENLKLERRRELALEGIRYYDLLRWGDAQTAITAANGVVAVKNGGVDAKYNVNFNPARVFSPLPESQIKVSQGKLVQNPGWQ